VISSGAPILLASATMFVNDWVPGSKQFSSDRKLKAYKTVTVFYGAGAAIVAWLGTISSVLQLLLLGFAMVVPPAIAVIYVFYWKKTTERAAFWGMTSGFVGGLTTWLLNTLFDSAEHAVTGGFAQWWHELTTYLGEWRDPSFVTLLVPLILIPVISVLDPKKDDDEEVSEHFYRKLGRIQKNFDWA